MDLYAMVLYSEHRASDLGRLASSLAPPDPGTEGHQQQPSPEYWVAASAFCALSCASTGQVRPPLLHASQLAEALHPGHLSARQPFAVQRRPCKSWVLAPWSCFSVPLLYTALAIPAHQSSSLKCPCHQA